MPLCRRAPHPAALEDYDRALELNPDDAKAYNNRGITNQNLGRMNEAREDFQKALAMAQEAGDENLVAMVKNNLRLLDNNAAP